MLRTGKFATRILGYALIIQTKANVYRGRMECLLLHGLFDGFALEAVREAFFLSEFMAN